jgi:HK97 family phage prohead protease
MTGKPASQMTIAELGEEHRALKREFVSLGREIIQNGRTLLAIRGNASFTKQGPMIEIKRVPGADTTITGYAAIFNVVDLGKDIVLPGAFAETLAKHKRDGTAPVMLWSHNMDEPIGVWEELAEDARGLKVKGRLLPSVRRAAEAIDLIGAGATTGLSIGYKALDYDYDPNTGFRRLKKLWLPEISVVSLPMQPQARIAGKELQGDEWSRALNRLSTAAGAFTDAVSR